MAFLEKLKNCQNGTFEPVHEIAGDFLKKPSPELNFFVVLGSYESLKGLEH